MSAAEDLAVVIAAVQQRRVVEATYESKRRLFCPHLIGAKAGQVKVFAWQFGGESSGPLPQWRCFDMTSLSAARLVEGWWRRGEITAHGRQACVERYAWKVDDADTAADFSDLEPLEG